MLRANDLLSWAVVVYAWGEETEDRSFHRNRCNPVTTLECFTLTSTACGEVHTLLAG